MGVPHPDFLLPQLSWRQFYDWQRYAEQEPFGEERADQRTQALACWVKLPASAAWGGEVPELVYPYWHTEDDLLREKAVLDKMVAEKRAKMSPGQRMRDTLAG